MGVSRVRVAAIVSHPDDEVLGAGGTLRKHVLAGDEIHVLILSSGITSRDDITPGQVTTIREQAECAAAIIGHKLLVSTCPDQRFDTVSLLSITKEIEAVILLHGPEVVYTHSLTDLNMDHVITARAVLTACRPQGGTVKRILSFEIPSSTEWSAEAFHPTVFSTLEKYHMATKVDALCQYAGEVRPAPHPRSVDGVTSLARWRGATVGAEYAEAFSLLRSVE